MIEVREQFCPKNHPCPAVSMCPQGAIVQDDVFSAPRIDHDLCTECGVCTGTCRVFAYASDGAPVGASS